MSSFKPCPECGGKRIEVVDLMHGPFVHSNIHVVPKAQSANLLQKVAEKLSNGSETMVLVCLQCGYVAWYATELEKLTPHE